MRHLLLAVMLSLPSIAWAEDNLVQKPPISLIGSKQVEAWLNRRVDELRMVRFKDDVDLFYHADPRIGYLVPVPDGICIDPRLEKKWHYVMPQVAKFLTELQEAYSKEFGEECPMINSAVRTIPRQMEITIGSGSKRNGNNKPNLNAAAVLGPRASLHLTGATIDIGKLDPVALKYDKMIQRNERVIKWLRKYLLALEVNDNFDVTEEFTQAVFHVTVLPTQPVVAVD